MQEKNNQTKRFCPHDFLALQAFRDWVMKELYEQGKGIPVNLREILTDIGCYLDDAITRYIQLTALEELREDCIKEKCAWWASRSVENARGDFEEIEDCAIKIIAEK